MATSVRRDHCPEASVQRSGSEGQCKASINPCKQLASLRAVNWHGTAKALEAFRTIGRSGGPFRFGGLAAVEMVCNPWQNLFQQVEPFAAHAAFERCKAGGVAARP